MIQARPDTREDAGNSKPDRHASAATICRSRAARRRLIGYAGGPVTSSNHSLLVDLAIILVLVLIAIVGYKYSPLLLPKADLTVTPAAGCNLNLRTCRADLPGGGGIELTLTPHPIPVVHPFQVEARLSGLSAERIEIDFVGINMDMGYNRQPLSETSDKLFTGQASLPVCVTGRMDWQATLLVESDHRRIAVPFYFAAPADGA